MMQARRNFKAKIKPGLLFLLLISLLLVGDPPPLQAQSRNPVIIRDTEIEAIFKAWSEPILKQAHIGKDNVNIVLVQSPDINAFVAGGANVFFYTGLIEKTESPEEILGVLAHEIGHIAGGHLIKTRDAMERASYESILGMVVGLGAAIATGQGEAAGAIMTGSQSMAAQRFFAHSRINESSADQAAFSYLKGAGLNASGLQSFFGKLQSQELLPRSQQSEYMRTHPITSDRVESIRALLDKHPSMKTAAIPAEWNDQYTRLKAKLTGYTSPGRVAWVYDDLDNSLPARYARTIAAYRQNDIQKALEGVDQLIGEEPDNPYFHELKGQMLAEFSRIEEALPPYQKAVQLKPDAALIRIALAHALIESGNDAGRLKEAIGHLERASNKERHSARIHRLLATAYGRLGQDTTAKLHLAEEAVLKRKLPYAKAQAEKALSTSKPNSREWLRAKDLLSHIENLERRDQYRG